MTRLAWPFSLLALTLGCGGTDEATSDSGVADARTAFDAADTIDATPQGFVQIPRAGDFPTPNLVLTEFDDAELEAAGVVATGFNAGSSMLVGNVDAPIEGDLLFPQGDGSSFVFTTPITAAGFSITDAAFGDDPNVVVTLTALDAADLEVGSVEVTVLPANSGDEENANAKFLGFASNLPVTTITINRDQPDNSMVLDNLMYRTQ